MHSLTKLALVAVFLCCLTGSLAPPVSKKTEEKKEKKPPGPADELLASFSPDDYKKYVEEVLHNLHTDKHFKAEWEKFKNATHKDPHEQATDLASQLEFVDHNVRTRLDEVKRKEVERLNALEKMLEAKRAAAGDPIKEAEVAIHPDVFNMDQDTIKKAHLDHDNPHSFEVPDLEKLIRQVVQDLHKVDLARQEQYKQYEMTKEHLRQRNLHKINDTKAREVAEKQFQELKQKHKQHEKVHNPGSLAQLTDLWINQDGLSQQFDAKTFFNLHDVNGDGHLDINEIEALFMKELDKVYNRTNDTSVSLFEKQHEMERMRQEVLEKVDLNKDMMISWEEFDRWTKNPDFKKDEDWKTSEENDATPYKEDEFKQFEDDYDRENPDEEDEQRRHDRDGDDRDSREHDDGGHHDGRRDKDQAHHDNKASSEHHDNKAPEHHGSAAPQQHGSAPEHQGSAPEHHEKAPEHHGSAPEHHDSAPLEHHDSAAPEHHDSAAPEHHSSAAPEHHGSAPEHHASAPEHHDSSASSSSHPSSTGAVHH